MKNKKLKYSYNAYQSWQAMRARCTNPKRPNYHLYGGRGIKVCDRWNSFENFLEDMGERPEGLQLDRIDNNGNYEPGNCKWATPKENSNNRRVQSRIEDITGKQFGDWTVLSKTDKRGNGGCVKWLCRCKCNKEVLVKRSALVGGVSSQCSECSRRWAVNLAQDLIGKIFGRWTVKEISSSRTVTGNILFMCVCECGMQQELVRNQLEKGRSKGCFDCYIKHRQLLECNICGCRGHKVKDIDESFCDLLGFCARCDGFNYQKFKKSYEYEF